MRTNIYRKLAALVAVAAFLAGHSSASADVLWNNEVDNGLGGVLVTHPGGMTGAVAGADRSAFAPGGTVFGFGNQGGTINNRMADDFTLSTAAVIDSFQFFVYQTGATTSTLTGATLQIWSGGAPGAGGTVIWGDTTTNVLTGNGLTNIYRTTDVSTTDANRRIQTADVGGLSIALAAGTYWADWTFTGTLTSGPWQPDIGTNLGGTAFVTGGNALQQIGTTPGVYNPALQGTTNVDLPFIVNGTATIPEPAGLSLLVLGAVGLVSRRRR